ncbi:MAG: histidine kinase [Bacteroidia bacterium]|nr:histidine kinase [Bacteroidia bacterium]
MDYSTRTLVKRVLSRNFTVGFIKIHFSVMPLLGILVATGIRAQVETPGLRHFTAGYELPGREVYTILQDRNGLIWFGTDRGLCRYDGYAFRTYTTKEGLLDNTVFQLQEDSLGRIWMLTFSGRVFYLFSDSIFSYRYNPVFFKEVANKIPIDFRIGRDGSVAVSLQGKGTFLVDSNGSVRNLHETGKMEGIHYYIDHSDGNTCLISMRVYSQSNSVLHVIPDRGAPEENFTLPDNPSQRFLAASSGTDIYATSGPYLFRIRKGRMENIRRFDSNILSLSPGSRKDIWVGTESGAFRISALSGKPDQKRVLDGIPVSDVLEDKEGGIWFGTINDGVYYSPGFGISGIELDEKSGLRPVSITAMEGNSILAGCWNGELVKWTPGNSLTIIRLPRTIENNPITRLTRWEGDPSVYLTTVNAGYLKDDKVFRFSNKLHLGIKTNFVRMPDGTRICSGTSSLFRISGDSLLYLTNFDERVNCIASFGKDKLLIGTNRGLFTFNMQDSTFLLFSPDIDDIRIDDMKWKGDTLCLATKGSGVLLKYKNSLMKINSFLGLGGDHISRLVISGDDIWCTSNNGVSRIRMNKEKDNPVTIMNINSSQGLPEGGARDICLLNDTVYVAMTGGISRFAALEDYNNYVPPSMGITAFRVNNIPEPCTGEHLFDASHNNLHIEFNAVSYRSKGNITYQYLLSGGSDTITSMTMAREVEFLSLPPGTYQFSVMARNSSGIWSKIPAEIHFKILPPWYNTWIFRALLLVTLLFVIFFAYRLRLKKLQKDYRIERKQAELQLTAMRAQMNPHFIFNVMNSIRNFMQHHDTGSAEKYLISFSKLVRYTLDHSGVQEVSLEDELNALKSYSELEMQRFEQGFKFDIYVEDGIDTSDYMLPALLLQPFVENAIKHGISGLDRQGCISVRVGKENDRIKVIIQDNGRGIDKPLVTGERIPGDVPHGMSLTFERILAYNKAFGRQMEARICAGTDQYGTVSGTIVEIRL